MTGFYMRATLAFDKLNGAGFRKPLKHYQITSKDFFHCFYYIYYIYYFYQKTLKIIIGPHLENCNFPCRLPENTKKH